MTRLSTTMLCALLLIAAAPGGASGDETGGAPPGVQDDAASQSPNTDPPPRLGRYNATFDQRSSLSTVETITTRFRAELKDPPADYAFPDESFEVYIPANYDGTERFGLIVWVSPGPNGAPPQPFRTILDKHKLIWIGANNAGNPRTFWHRAGLALDALHNITQHYHIDPMRTYVSGLSGGGRCSSRIGLTYADLFAGAFPIIGVDYFKKLPHPDSTATKLVFWGAKFNPPSPRILRKAKRDGRYVLLTGETDGNRLQTLVTYQYGFKRARFSYITYLEAPGMGHTVPPPDWFEKGITALDAPLPEVRERREKEAERKLARAMDRLQRSPPHGIEALEELLRDFPDTTFATQAAEQLKLALENPAAAQTAKPKSKDTDQPKPSPPSDRAREDMALARNYLQAGRTDLARDLFNQVIEYYPDTDEAEQAKALLEGMTAQD